MKTERYLIVNEKQQPIDYFGSTVDREGKVYDPAMVSGPKIGPMIRHANGMRRPRQSVGSQAWGFAPTAPTACFLAKYNTTTKELEIITSQQSNAIAKAEWDAKQDRKALAH